MAVRESARHSTAQVASNEASGVRVDTIIFIVLLVTAVFAAKGSPPKVVVPLFFVGFVLTAFVFNHHVTSTLDLSF